jgi:hypothetical protein
MSNEAVIAVVVGAVVLLLIIVAVVMAVRARRRHRHLREQFGPEYDRTVQDAGTRREAEQELESREKRHAGLEIRPLDPKRRADYQTRWAVIQERFVDSPDEAVGQADELVTVVMAERGYPTETYEQQVTDLSVEHAATLQHYRAAHDVDKRRRDSKATTEELRQAMVHYRALFADLLGTSVGSHRDR